MGYQPLISTQRAVQNSLLANLSSTNPVYLNSLIQVASDAVRRYCAGRIFTLSEFTEYYSIGIRKTETPLMMLRQFPVKSITRVGLMTRALAVQNGNQGQYSRANASTTDLGLVLTTVASGVTATTNLYYGTYPTLGQLATAVGALANGWSANVQAGINGSFNSWASSDLKPIQGAVSTFLGGCYLEIPQDVSIGYTGPYSWDENNAYGGWNQSGPGWRLDSETGEMWFNCRRGALNLRVDYVAGFDEVPQDVQEATIMTAISAWQIGKINPLLKSESALDYSYTYAMAMKMIPDAAQSILNTYRDWAAYSTRGSG